MRLLRSMLRLLPLLLVAVFTFTESRSLASPEPPSTTLAPTSSYEPSFSDWTPCQPETGGLTLTEWAACSTAYNTDRARSFTTVSLFIIAAFTVGSFLLLARR